MDTSGYSGTPLPKKLGIKDGFIIKIINRPDYYFDLFPYIPVNLVEENTEEISKDFIHYFEKDRSNLELAIPSLKNEIKQNGMIWISWPKKASKVKSDITEDVIRNFALQNGLVDIKVCSINDIWSALKLVIPVKDRKNEN